MYKRLFGERDMTREETNRNQHLYLDPRRGVPRSNARSGFAQLARKRKAQFADLATLPASSRRRECVLGEAPSAAEKEQLTRLPQEILEQDAAQKAKFDKLTEEGKKDGAQLLADRADGEDAELRKNLREKTKGGRTDPRDTSQVQRYEPCHRFRQRDEDRIRDGHAVRQRRDGSATEDAQLYRRDVYDTARGSISHRESCCAFRPPRPGEEPRCVLGFAMQHARLVRAAFRRGSRRRFMDGDSV